MWGLFMVRKQVKTGHNNYGKWLIKNSLLGIFIILIGFLNFYLGLIIAIILIIGYLILMSKGISHYRYGKRKVLRKFRKKNRR